MRRHRLVWRAMERQLSVWAAPGLILFLARSAQPEPRLALSPRGPAIFGVDLDQLRPGQAAVLDNSAIGYPVSLADLPPGDYVAQAVINVYEQVRRAEAYAALH